MDIKSSDFKPTNNETFTPKEKVILNITNKFLTSHQKYIDIILEIINGESRTSLRLLEWLVTGYSNKNNIFYETNNDLFYINKEYRNEVNKYSKRYFDPFCRQKKIIYTYHSKDSNKDTIFSTSIGQLNFFQWAIKNKVITYLENHLDEIKEDMISKYKLI